MPVFSGGFMTVKLIAGLGNPGSEYAHTRHNMGVDVMYMIADRYGISLRTDSKYNGEVGRGMIEGQEVRLVFPTTYMNKSGDSIGPLANFFKIKPEEILVIHDELDLPPGVAKYKLGGGPGGHNGLKSIIACLGNCQNFHRLRIGIGKPVTRAEMINFVLGKPPKAEMELIEQAKQAAVESIGLLFTQNIAKATNMLNGFKAGR